MRGSSSIIIGIDCALIFKNVRETKNVQIDQAVPKSGSYWKRQLKFKNLFMM